MEDNATENNPFRLSSEYADEELGLVYYNYRYYNSLEGRWIGRDPIGEVEIWNLYEISKNHPNVESDYLGLRVMSPQMPTGLAAIIDMYLNGMITAKEAATFAGLPLAAFLDYFAKEYGGGLINHLNEHIGNRVYLWDLWWKL